MENTGAKVAAGEVLGSATQVCREVSRHHQSHSGESQGEGMDTGGTANRGGDHLIHGKSVNPFAIATINTINRIIPITIIIHPRIRLPVLVTSGDVVRNADTWWPSKTPLCGKQRMILRLDDFCLLKTQQ